MEFEKVIKERFSTRAFQPNKKIEKEKLDKILEAGRIAPTARNIQPQKIYVVESTKGIEKIDRITPCRYNAPTCLLICSDKDIAWKNEDETTCEMDASIVTTHMMLEATNIGVDSVWVRHFDKEIAKKEFNLPDNIIPICLLPLGYREENCKPSPMHTQKKSLEEMVEYR